MNHTSWTETVAALRERAEKAEARVRELETIIREEAERAHRTGRPGTAFAMFKAAGLSPLTGKPSPSVSEGPEAEDPLTPSERATGINPAARGTCCAVKNGTGGGIVCDRPVHHRGPHSEGGTDPWPAEPRTMHEKWPPVPRPEGTPPTETRFIRAPAIASVPCPSEASPGLNPGVRVHLRSSPASKGVVDGWIGPSHVRVAWNAGHRSEVIAASLVIDPCPNEALVRVEEIGEKTAHLFVNGRQVLFFADRHHTKKLAETLRAALGERPCPNEAPPKCGALAHPRSQLPCVLQQGTHTIHEDTNGHSWGPDPRADKAKAPTPDLVSRLIQALEWCNRERLDIAHRFDSGFSCDVTDDVEGAIAAGQRFLYEARSETAFREPGIHDPPPVVRAWLLRITHTSTGVSVKMHNAANDLLQELKAPPTGGEDP